MRTGKDLRRHERKPCDQNVTITWRDAKGENKFAVVRAVDISERGMRLHMPEAPPLNSYVFLRATKLGLVGNAAVRYCVRSTPMKYSVGAEFTAGLEWSQDKPTPVPAIV